MIFYLIIISLLIPVIMIGIHRADHMGLTVDQWRTIERKTHKPPIKRLVCNHTFLKIKGDLVQCCKCETFSYLEEKEDVS